MSDEDTKIDDTIPQPSDDVAEEAAASEPEPDSQGEDDTDEGDDEGPELEPEESPSVEPDPDEVLELKAKHAVELEEVMHKDMSPAEAANMTVSADRFGSLAKKAAKERGSVGRKRLRVLAIHGINTGDDDPVAEVWEEILNENGIRCKVEELRWGSTGMISGDVAAFTNMKFRRDVNKKIEDGILKFAVGGGGVILCHSMGTVLALHANRKLHLKLPIICMASPLSNRALIGQLKAIGYGQTAYGNPTHYWNDDDPIVGGSAALQPNYFNAVRIAVPDPEARKMNANSEHDVRLYLGHPLVLDGIMEAAKAFS